MKDIKICIKLKAGVRGIATSDGTFMESDDEGNIYLGIDNTPTRVDSVDTYVAYMLCKDIANIADIESYKII